MGLIKNEYGEIEYRLPNIPETMIILGESGLTSALASGDGAAQRNDFILMGKMVQNIGKFITRIDVTIKGKKVTEFEESLNYFEMMDPYVKIVEEIMGAISAYNSSKESKGKKKST